MVEYLIAYVIGVLSAATIEAGRFFITRKERLKLKWFCMRKRNSLVRVSAAYLFRIKINGRYLLIRGKRIKDQYQPVGGVYKFFSSSEETQKKLGIEADNGMKNISEDHDDLRIRLPRKNLLKFIDWFDGKTGREVETWREFSEELIDGGYLSLENIGKYAVEFVRRSDRDVRFSTYLAINELLMFDIFEVKLSDSAINELTEYIEAHPFGPLVLAASEDIEHGTIDSENGFLRIGEHTRWVI